ncbi:hypothetical protein E4U19_000919 [Claviceps sp. Clav32 group G5]|nr:hypothetical protein E4U19_000919 [Claviceps sp. Clav32 group G5]
MVRPGSYFGRTSADWSAARPSALLDSQKQSDSSPPGSIKLQTSDSRLQQQQPAAAASSQQKQGSTRLHNSPREPTGMRPAQPLGPPQGPLINVHTE